jgi:hypothetical protein
MNTFLLLTFLAVPFLVALIGVLVARNKSRYFVSLARRNDIHLPLIYSVELPMKYLMEAKSLPAAILTGLYVYPTFAAWSLFAEAVLRNGAVVESWVNLAAIDCLLFVFGLGAATYVRCLEANKDFFRWVAPAPVDPKGQLPSHVIGVFSWVLFFAFWFAAAAFAILAISSRVGSTGHN